MKITLKQLETFVWVADLGSFRRAAERLNTTQPNISSRIAALEKVLNVSLMERDAGSVKLTVVGERVLLKARAALRSIESVVDAATATHQLDGNLRLGVTEMVAHTWLNKFLKQFKATYPNIHLELSVDLAVNLETELEARNLDLCFHSGPFSSTMTQEMSLGSFPMVWVVSSESPLAKLDVLTPTDFADQTVITHAKNTVAYREITGHFLQQYDLHLQLSPSSNLMVAMQMVEDGYGIGALLAPLVEQPIQEGRLTELKFDWYPSSLGFFARYDRERANGVMEYAANTAQRLSNACADKFQ